MEAIERLRDGMHPFAKDIQLNLSSVLSGGALTDTQRWAIAVACAITTESAKVREAVLMDAATKIGEVALGDAKAAACLMAMNNVYYRFRHLVGKESYSTKPARLRMQPDRAAEDRQGNVRADLPGGQRNQRVRGVHSEPRARRPGGRADRGSRARRRPDRSRDSCGGHSRGSVTRAGADGLTRCSESAPRPSGHSRPRDSRSPQCRTPRQRCVDNPRHEANRAVDAAHRHVVKHVNDRVQGSRRQESSPGSRRGAARSPSGCAPRPRAVLAA